MRFIGSVVFALCLFLPVGLALSAFQPEPSIAQNAPLSPRQAALGQDLLLQAKATADGTEANGRIQASEAALNGLIASTARVIQPLQGRAQIDETGMRLRLSAQLPGMERLGWLNLDLQIAPSESQLELAHLRLGPHELPPKTTLAALRGALDLATAGDLGSALLDSVVSVRMRRDIAVLTLDAGDADMPSLYARLKTELDAIAGDQPNEAVLRHAAALEAAVTSGELAASDGFTAWLSFVLTRVGTAEHESPLAARADMEAAILALAAHCGGLSDIGLDRRIQAGEMRNGCIFARLKGRRDLRRHFILSAALQIMGGSEVSFGFGELKELVDGGSATGSGYSFDDIAADRAGIRFAERLAMTDPADYAALAAQIQQDEDYMPALDDLPSRLSAQSFAARYDRVDSPAYRAQIHEIDQRISALPLHRS